MQIKSDKIYTKILKTVSFVYNKNYKSKISAMAMVMRNKKAKKKSTRKPKMVYI